MELKGSNPTWCLKRQHARPPAALVSLYAKQGGWRFASPGRMGEVPGMQWVAREWWAVLLLLLRRLGLLQGGGNWMLMPLAFCQTFAQTPQPLLSSLILPRHQHSCLHSSSLKEIFLNWKQAMGNTAKFDGWPKREHLFWQSPKGTQLAGPCQLPKQLPPPMMDGPARHLGPPSPAEGPASLPPAQQV